MGEIEVEYEGTESFLRDELPQLLAAVSKLHHDSAGASGERSKTVRNGKVWLILTLGLDDNVRSFPNRYLDLSYKHE